MAGAGESHQTLRPGELQPGLAAEGGVGRVVVHQEGEVGLHEDGVRGAAQGDELQEEPAVGPDVLLTVWAWSELFLLEYFPPPLHCLGTCLELYEGAGAAGQEVGERPDLSAGQESLVDLEPVPALGGVPQLEVQDPGDEGLVGRDHDPPAAVEPRLVVLGVGGGHDDGRGQEEHLLHLLAAGLPDGLGADTGVGDGHQALAPHLALHHVQQEAELALLPAGVAAAPPE